MTIQLKYNVEVDSETGLELTDLTANLVQDVSTVYFHDRCFTAGGNMLVRLGPLGSNQKLGLLNFDSRTLDIFDASGARDSVAVLPKRNCLLYNRNGSAIHCLDLATGAGRCLYKAPEGTTIFSHSASATEDVAAVIIGPQADCPFDLAKHPTEAVRWGRKLGTEHSLMLVPLDGERVQGFYRQNQSLSHLQFSPTDPNLLMFCLNGHWQDVQRIWVIHRDGGGLRMIRPQAPGEGVGHEFFSADGKTIWYDLRKGPVTEDAHHYWRNVTPFVGRAQTYGEGFEDFSIPADSVSVHYNVGLHENLLSGEGYFNSPYIFAFKISDGRCTPYKLCRSTCTYSPLNDTFNPDAHFSPDGRNILFTNPREGVSRVLSVSAEV